ncbi:MAG: hypothetical protein NVS9B15_10560 [Acidobacteriaceae bacterium]
MFHTIGIFAGIIIYFLPAIIASKRSHPSFTAIMLVNFFLGWTFIGWIVCFVWALSGDHQAVVLQPVHPLPPALFCTNCGARAHGDYCPKCGSTT